MATTLPSSIARSTRHLPLKSSLTPLAFQLQARNRNTASTRNHASSSSAAAAVAGEPEPESLEKPQQSRRKPLSKEQKRFLDAALRVNQAGELAATRIYTAQTPPTIKAHPELRGLMKHMYDQEAGHFNYFNAILAKHRIRPTAMYPVWTAMSTALGWSTAILGREAAMACTEAVETEIGEHYNNQVQELLRWVKEMEARGETIGQELQGLVSEIRRIRDEELEHLDHAVEHDAKQAEPYELLTGVIRAGCRGAIWVSEKV